MKETNQVPEAKSEREQPSRKAAELLRVRSAVKAGAVPRGCPSCGLG